MIVRDCLPLLSTRIIKMSSPRLNNVILVGCALAYCYVLMLEVNVDSSVPMCEIRSFTILLGFSLSFGALFAKTWRVYQIFTAGSALKRLNTKMLRDSSLFLIVSALVIINSLILVTWSVISPQMQTLVQISTTPADLLTDIEFVNLHLRCDSPHKPEFTWAILALQGMVILAGTFLAVQTRKVSCPELNDSKWIGVCIYHVVVLCPLAVVVVMATENSPDTCYALEASITILMTTMTQCLIFFPKIIAYRKYNEAHSSQSNLALHNGSSTFSRHSDTPSTSTRSIMTCEFPSQLAYGHPECVASLKCPNCHCYLNTRTFTDSLRLKWKSANIPARIGSRSSDGKHENTRHSYQIQELGVKSACISSSFCRPQTPGYNRTVSHNQLTAIRSNSDSNLNRYILRRYVSLE